MPTIALAPVVMQNLLLMALPRPDLEQILPYFKTVTLSAKTILLPQNEPVNSVYFLQSGTVSMISRLKDGEQAEVGLVGREGMVGLSVYWERLPPHWKA